MKKLKTVLIGLGDVAEMHVKGYIEIEGINLVAGADLSEERRNYFNNNFGIRTYYDYKEMFRVEKPDIACVLLPAKLHSMVVCDAARAKINVFCEKPLADTLENCVKMIETCNNEKVKLFYGASYRYLPACIRAKNIIKSGEIGEIMYICERVIGGKGYSSFKDLGSHHYALGFPGGGGMGLVDHGVHFVDLFRWFLESEIIDIYGRGNISGKPPVTEHLTITFENGAVGQLTYNEATFYSDMPNEGIFSRGVEYNVTGEVLLSGTFHNYPISIRIHGKEGALRIFPYGNRLFIMNREGTKEISLDESYSSPKHFGAQIKAFAENIINDEEPQITGKDGFYALKTIYETYSNIEKTT